MMPVVQNESTAAVVSFSSVTNLPDMLRPRFVCFDWPVFDNLLKLGLMGGASSRSCIRTRVAVAGAGTTPKRSAVRHATSVRTRPILVSAVDKLAVGQMKEVEVGDGRTVLLARTGEAEVHAVGPKCSCVRAVRRYDPSNRSGRPLRTFAVTMARRWSTGSSAASG